MGVVDDRHDFGGEWTEVKLAALDAYSHFYTTALKNQSFELWYIDPFAGTGARIAKKDVGGLFDGRPSEVEEETKAGSARRALGVEPPFKHLVLMDRRPTHFRALESLREEFSDRDIRVIKGDANDNIDLIFRNPPWRNHASSAAQRALVFLDPYGMNVRWETLLTLATSRQADVWYLVNLKGVVQQLAHNHAALDEHKRRALSTFFGTNDWEGEFYRFREQSTDLFNLPSATGYRAASREEIANFYRRRLETLFCYVSTPLGLKVKGQEDYFQLYCMSNNNRAKDLISRGAESVIKRLARASRHKSDP